MNFISCTQCISRLHSNHFKTAKPAFQGNLLPFQVKHRFAKPIPQKLIHKIKKLDTSFGKILVLCPIYFAHKTGTANAKAKGVRIVRPELTKEDIPPIFYRHFPAYVKGELNITELARVCDMSRTTVYRYINLLKV